MFSTSFMQGKIDIQELETLLNWLGQKTGATVQIETQIVVSTDSAEITNMLDALKNALANGELQPMKKMRKSRKQKVESIEPKKAPTRGPHVRSIELKGSGEMISRFELDKRLEAHTITPGTALHSPKHGLLFVKNGGGEGQPYTLVNEQGEPV